MAPKSKTRRYNNETGTAVNKSNNFFSFSQMCKIWVGVRIQFRIGINMMLILNTDHSSAQVDYHRKLNKERLVK
jgi:hypothetical protein